MNNNAVNFGTVLLAIAIIVSVAVASPPTYKAVDSFQVLVSTIVDYKDDTTAFMASASKFFEKFSGKRILFEEEGNSIESGFDSMMDSMISSIDDLEKQRKESFDKWDVVLKNLSEKLEGIEKQNSELKDSVVACKECIYNNSKYALESSIKEADNPIEIPIDGTIFDNSGSNFKSGLTSNLSRQVYIEYPNGVLIPDNIIKEAEKPKTKNGSAVSGCSSGTCRPSRGGIFGW